MYTERWEGRKKEASKVKRTTRQSNTAHPRQSLFELPRVGLEPTTFYIHSRQSTCTYTYMYMYMYMYLNHILMTSSSLISSDRNRTLMRKHVPRSLSDFMSLPYMAVRVSTSSSWRAWHSRGGRSTMGGGVRSVFCQSFRQSEKQNNAQVWIRYCITTQLVHKSDIFYTLWPWTCVNTMLIRDAEGRKEEGSKAIQTTNQSNTIYPLFQEKWAASGGIWTHETLHSKQNALPCIYMYR